jgi:hypothetical protein
MHIDMLKYIIDTNIALPAKGDVLSSYKFLWLNVHEHISNDDVSYWLIVLY